MPRGNTRTDGACCPAGPVFAVPAARDRAWRMHNGFATPLTRVRHFARAMDEHHQDRIIA